MLLATHSLHFRVHTRVFVTLLVLLAVTTLALAEPPHRLLLKEATAAQKAGNSTLLIEKLEAARVLRPDYPRVLLALARSYATAGRTDDALDTLRSLADMGLAFPIAQDPALASLCERAPFKALAESFAANAQTAPGTSKEITCALPGVDGIIESVAIDRATGATYFGDVRNRCIWKRDAGSPAAAAHLVRFTHSDDSLLGVLGLKLDRSRNALWAGTAAVEPMRDYAAADKGRAALVEFDLTTGRARRSFAVPADGREHVLGDLVIARDGTIYATDSTAPIIWRLAPGATSLERWLESDNFVSLQGIAFSADQSSLFVADYANGLWHVTLADRNVALLPPPPKTTLFGIDGLYATRDALIATQNGISPQRVLRIALDASGKPTGATVLRSGHAAMTDVTLGQIVDNQFHFIANAGWESSAPHTVTILHTAVDTAARRTED